MRVLDVSASFPAEVPPAHHLTFPGLDIATCWQLTGSRPAAEARLEAPGGTGPVPDRVGEDAR